MTEAESLQLTVLQWSWLRDNPTCGKSSWPGWDNPNGVALTYKSKSVISNCFLCNYYLSFCNYYLSCLGCPLLGHDVRCQTYWQWKTSDIGNRVTMAEDIIRKCENKLKELNQ